MQILSSPTQPINFVHIVFGKIYLKLRTSHVLLEELAKHSSRNETDAITPAVSETLNQLNVALQTKALAV